MGEQQPPRWCGRECIGIFKYNVVGGEGGHGEVRAPSSSSSFYVSCPVREDEDGRCSYFHNLLGGDVGDEDVAKRWREGNKGGKYGWKLAITKVDIVEESKEGVRVMMSPVTGRRHQLRLHVKAMGGWIK